jgi:hypothetical protein
VVAFVQATALMTYGCHSAAALGTQRRSSARLTLNLRLGRLDDRKKSAQGCPTNPDRHQWGRVLV